MLERLASESDAIRAEETKLYDRSFVLAFASQTCFVVANTLLAHYARWIEFLGGDLSQIGWIMGAGSAAGLLLRPWMAQWINQIGAKSAWGLGYALFSVGSIANLALIDVGWPIYLVRSANVLGAAVVFAAGLTYVSQLAPEGRRTEAIGILGVGGFLGMLIGPYLGDFLLGGESRGRSEFSSIFLVATFSNVLPAILLVFLRTPTHARAQRALRVSDFVQIVRRYWPGRILLVNMTFGMCMTVPFVFVASFIDDLQLNLGRVSLLGLFFWVYAGWAILIRVSLRRMPERVGAKRVLLAGLLFMAGGMFAFCAVSSERSWLLIIPAVLTGTGHSLMFHTMTSLTIQPFPTQVRGTASALALMMLDLGMFMGAPILGIVGEAMGYSAMFVMVGIMCLVCTSIYARSN